MATLKKEKKNPNFNHEKLIQWCFEECEEFEVNVPILRINNKNQT